MIKRFSTILVFSVSLLTLQAQSAAQLLSSSASNQSVKSFEHLDLSINASIVGFGLELAAPLNRSFSLRTGFHFIPKFKHEMTFGIGLENDDTPSQEAGVPITQSKFDKMAELFTNFTGCPIDDHVDMIGEPSMYNFSFLVDVAPFKDKRWHFTAGIFAGPSQIAKAYNTTEDMPTLFSVKLYNRIYESAYNDEPMFIYGDNAVYVDPDMADKVLEYGRMSINIGDRADGAGKYHLEPDIQSMVKVKMKVNKVRPYVGFGFGNQINKKNPNGKFSFSVDAGVMFWGGTPRIITHDGTDLAQDVVNIRGNVNDYVRVMKKLKVCPMISIKIARRLF